MHLTADNLSFAVGNKPILKDVNLNVADATSIALTGPSGCGKTTLLYCLALILKPTTGSIHFDGQDATTWPTRKRAALWRNQAAFIFQDYGLVEDEPVGFNVCMAKAPLWGTHKRGWGNSVENALTAVGLAGRATEPVSQLSGGERQRVGIARAIHKQATIIFADEPTASLDAENRQLVQDLLFAQTNTGATIVIATHDLSLAAACDQNLPLSTNVQR